MGGRELSLTFSNSWDRPETLTGLSCRAVPRGRPAKLGTVLAPRRAITITVRFDPVRAGDYESTLRIETDHGSVALPVSGEALQGTPRLAVSASHIDFGAVPVGRSRTLTFYVSDAGNVPLTITRAIAPLGEFSATVALPEGITIEAGLRAAVTVTFRPTARGPASGRCARRQNCWAGLPQGALHRHRHLTGRGARSDPAGPRAVNRACVRYAARR